MKHHVTASFSYGNCTSPSCSHEARFSCFFCLSHFCFNSPQSLCLPPSLPFRPSCAPPLLISDDPNWLCLFSSSFLVRGLCQCQACCHCLPFSGNWFPGWPAPLQTTVLASCTFLPACLICLLGLFVPDTAHCLLCCRPSSISLSPPPARDHAHMLAFTHTIASSIRLHLFTAWLSSLCLAINKLAESNSFGRKLSCTKWAHCCLMLLVVSILHEDARGTLLLSYSSIVLC